MENECLEDPKSYAKKHRSRRFGIMSGKYDTGMNAVRTENADATKRGVPSSSKNPSHKSRTESSATENPLGMTPHQGNATPDSKQSDSSRRTAYMPGDEELFDRYAMSSRRKSQSRSFDPQMLTAKDPSQTIQSVVCPVRGRCYLPAVWNPMVFDDGRFFSPYILELGEKRILYYLPQNPYARSLSNMHRTTD